MTSPHISENLPRLLTGDANRDEVMAAAEHLRNCPDCLQELISAVVAHASLTSAHRFAPDIVAPDSTGEGEDSAHDVDDDAGAPLPDMSAMFAKVRAEASDAAARPQHRRRLIAVAAAAAVLVGGGVTLAETVGSNSSSPDTVSVALRPFDTGDDPAKVTVAGARMRVDATALPRLDSGHFYEVWLTDAARKRMQSVGSIDQDNKAELTVPANVMSQYTAIEVSVQRTNETAYSGTSVLRGSYG
jgi:anti-sigma-K factor RskA